MRTVKIEDVMRWLLFKIVSPALLDWQMPASQPASPNSRKGNFGRRISNQSAARCMCSSELPACKAATSCSKQSEIKPNATCILQMCAEGERPIGSLLMRHCAQPKRDSSSKTRRAVVATRHPE